jgi:hypothetical protein
MHTVPAGYMKAFAVPEADRRTPRVWRFGRDGSAKLLGIFDAEVVKDIYSVVGTDGRRDTGIEDDFLDNLDGAFCTIRDSLIVEENLTVDSFSALARFVAFQLMRTPRSLQMIRDFADEAGEETKTDMPQRVMLELARRAIPRLARMKHNLTRHETNFPLLTSDNPVVTWRMANGVFECGVDLRVRDVVVTFPLSPALMYIAYQTLDSFKTTRNAEAGVKTPGNYKINVGFCTMDAPTVKHLNTFSLENAHSHVYANHDTPVLRRFLENKFYGRTAAQRRSF